MGQSFNGAGIAFFARVVVVSTFFSFFSFFIFTHLNPPSLPQSERSMAVPHLEVADLRQVRWDALAAAGFRGCIFDKDNTLTEPYRLELHPSAAAALADCTAAFDGRVVLYSNSAGLEQFDPEGTEAAALEAALGVPVLRHREKKPAGGPEDVERHFGCPAHRLIMIGDRYLTDIAFGNRLGMLTIRPEPFTAEGETRTVRAARAVEGALAGRSRAAGVPPPPHPLVPEGPQGLDQFLRDVGEMER